jgi:asparagine synthase (glutamine-hydrolysing)
VSSLLAVLSGNDARPAPPTSALRATLRSSLGESFSRVDAWTSDDRRAALAVAREDWECAPWLAGEAEVVTIGHVSVAADASLYARSALSAELARAGHPTSDDSATGLIAAVFLARGVAGLLELNGDFAFVLWDAQRRTMLLGRDFVGSRTLYYTVAKSRLIVASTLAGVLSAAGGNAPSFDRLALAEAASGLSHPSGRTAYSGVWAVPAGRVMSVGPALRIEEAARWNPPTFETGSKTSFTDAANELRDLLRHAVADRMAPDLSTIWMSGGYDSTSVFATARAALAAGSPGQIETLSVSYPEGDQGREDDIIEMVLKHHGVAPRFIDSAELPLLGDIARNAARRDNPFAAMYDGFFRRASRGSRDVGARVALSGHGGDILFDSPLVYFADLLSGFHLRTLVEEWRKSREAVWGRMELIEVALGPLVPEQLAKSTMQMLGKAKERFHQPAPWVRKPVSRAIANTGWMPLERRSGESRSSAVARWALTYPFFIKSQEAAAAVSREMGIEYRTPILDPRVIALAATRPRWEKRSGVRSKSLLRAAMKGMLPEQVLWPRLYKTGLTKDYLMRSVQQEFPVHAAALRRESVLADLGVIDPTHLSKAISDSASDSKGWIAAHLYFTFQVEYWLRARLSVAGQGASLDDAESGTASRRTSLIA